MEGKGKGYWDLSPEERSAGNWDLKGDVSVSTGSYAPPGPGPRTVYALGQDGQPVPFDTERGFELQADAPPGQLTPEEIAEFRELRAAKKKADEQAAREAEEAAARLQAPTHYVRLADGSIIEGSALATHYDNGRGLIPVASVHELAPVLIP